MTSPRIYGYEHRQEWPSYLHDPGTWYGSEEAKGRYANILLDYWFKRAFGNENRKRLLQLLLQELIPERTINELRYAPQEYVNLFPGKKDIRVDIECTDDENNRFIVELQVAPQNWIFERALYYSSFALIQQMEKGVDEYLFPPVYFIGILDFCVHQKEQDRVLFRYQLRDMETGDLMTDRIQFIFLELPNCTKALTPEASVLDNFCYSLHNMQFLPNRPLELRQEIFELLFESADIAKFTPDERIKYDHDMTTDRDRRNQLKKATEDGLKEGWERGLEKGMEKGMEKGKNEGRKELIKALLHSGMSEKEVQQRLNLSAEQWKTLIEDYSLTCVVGEG